MPRIAHVALWTRDLDRAAAFWRDYFTAEVGELYESKRRPGFASRFVRFEDGAALELMTGPWLPEIADAGKERPGWAHVAVSLGSEQAVIDLARRLAEQGLLISAPRRTGDGFFEAVIKDPDGNPVEITD